MFGNLPCLERRINPTSRLTFPRGDTPEVQRCHIHTYCPAPQRAAAFEVHRHTLGTYNTSYSTRYQHHVAPVQASSAGKPDFCSHHGKKVRSDTSKKEVKIVDQKKKLWIASIFFQRIPHFFFCSTQVDPPIDFA